MNYRVNRPFRWQGMVRGPGQVLELSVAEAARLRASGVIGGPEQSVRPPAERAVPPKSERTVKPPEETRKGTPRQKAAKPPVTEHEETDEPVPEDPASD